MFNLCTAFGKHYNISAMGLAKSVLQLHWVIHKVGLR